MEFLYRLLGIVARMSERMSHLRINFVPINWGLLVVSAMVAFAALFSTVEAIANGGTPRTLRVGDVIQHRDTSWRNYVRLTGVLHPEGGLTESREGSSTADRTWSPMTDGSGKHAILVELKEGRAASKKPGIVTITGMLHPAPSALADELGKNGNKVGPMEVDPEYVLEEGGEPGHPLLMGLLFLVSGTLAAMMLFTACTQYVVFRKTKPAPANTDTSPFTADIMVQATGRFILDGQHVKRFLNVPALLTDLENGHTALLANVDASSRYMGITTAKRAGIWAMVMQPNSLKSVELGLLYIGFAAVPAIRFHFVDGSDSSHGCAIVTCEDVMRRDMVLKRLTQPFIPPAPASPPPASGLPVASVIPEPPAGASTQPS